ncbi:hypothetical protein ACIBBE_09555 [Streptomyces sp. NPDC051644]|uniref:hypothetical protein n=1 Tax=Streptomyces sp. NPDC051644 TaxID=3365666 RepID=UPI0037B642BD
MTVTSLAVPVTSYRGSVPSLDNSPETTPTAAPPPPAGAGTTTSSTQGHCRRRRGSGRPSCWCHGWSGTPPGSWSRMPPDSAVARYAATPRGSRTLTYDLRSGPFHHPSGVHGMRPRPPPL